MGAGCVISTRASFPPTTAPIVFPYAQYGYGNAYLEQIVTNGRADYDALQMRMQKRMSGGLSYTVAYTWSKALGDFLDHLSAGGGAIGNAPESTYAMEKDYGLLAFDIPHRLVTSFIYELPFGPGRQLRVGRRRRRDRPRLVGQRHPDAERRPAVHGDGDRSGRHGPGPHLARELRRRRGAERVQPEAGFVDGSGGVHADDDEARTGTARTTRCGDRGRSR